MLPEYRATVYYTCLLFTAGIVRFDNVEVCEYPYKRVWAKVESSVYGRIHMLVGRDCFLTKEEAIACAEAKRADKIEALKRRIRELESMKFE